MPVLLDGISGDALELAVKIRPGSATRVGLRVHCDAEGRGGVGIVVDREAGTLTIGHVVAPFELGESEDLGLRVFVDKSVVEAFANDRQAMVDMHSYDSSVYTTLVADGDKARCDVSAWRMKSIYDSNLRTVSSCTKTRE